MTSVNPLYKEAEVAHQLEDSETTALFVSKLFMGTAESIQDRLPGSQRILI